jgi:hypothetical protein
VYPVKLGFMGYIMVLYGFFKASKVPYLPALVFLPVFALGTDFFAMIFRGRRTSAAQAPASDAQAVSATGPGKEVGGEGAKGKPSRSKKLK